jgi:acetoin utilization deacetylase AcuC-like enzyme
MAVPHSEKHGKHWACPPYIVFDAHERDPLAQLEVQDADYNWITRELGELATDSAGGKVVSILEGGYDMRALASAGRAHVHGLQNSPR